MPEIPEWIVQGGVVNIIADAFAIGIPSWYAGRYIWKNKEMIAAKLKQAPKPTVVPLDLLQITSTLGQASIKAGSSLTLRWNVQEPTPSLSTRLVDEAIEMLSVLPRHL